MWIALTGYVDFLALKASVYDQEMQQSKHTDQLMASTWVKVLKIISKFRILRLT